jgi:hypothetical protein
MQIEQLTELEFRDRVGFVVHQLERSEISRTLAASDLRRLLLGRAKHEQQQERIVAARRNRDEHFAALAPHAKTPLDMGVARFAADVFALTGH